jgi:hypothetical protein
MSRYEAIRTQPGETYCNYLGGVQRQTCVEISYLQDELPMGLTGLADAGHLQP